MLVFDANINQELINQLEACQKSLRIIMYSISPKSSRSKIQFLQVWQTLKKTIERLPDVKILLSGWPDSNPQAIATARAALDLLNMGAEVRIGQIGRIIHPKAFCFDNRTLLIGSHNATEAGFTRTQNISYIGGSDMEIGQFNDYFEKQWQSINQK